MTELADHTQTLTAIAAMLCVLGMLHVFASRTRHETGLHDLKARAIDLRLKQIALARAAREMLDPDLVPQDTEPLVRYILLGEIPGPPDPNPINPDLSDQPGFARAA